MKSIQAETLLQSLERAAAGIGLHVNPEKRYTCALIKESTPSHLETSGQVHHFRNSVSSTEKDINTWWAKTWTAIDRLSVIYKSDLTDKIKRSFFQAAVVSILIYECTTWTLLERMGKKLDMLQAILNKSWRHHPSKYSCTATYHPSQKTIQVRQTRNMGQCLRIRYELRSDILRWTHSHGWDNARQPART